MNKARTTSRGTMYFRITEIISFFKDLSSIPEETLKRKGIIGTNVHQAISAYYDESLDAKDMTETEHKYFQSFLKWRFIEQGHPFMIEKRFYDEDRLLSGQIDLILQKDGCKYLVDFKTTYTADPVFWPIQGAFYYSLVKPVVKDLQPEVIFVQLKREKKPTCYSFTITDDLLHVCESMYEVFKFLNK